MTGEVGSETTDSDPGEAGTEQIEQDSKEQTPEEAEASFAAGFESVANDDSTLGDDPEPEDDKPAEEQPPGEQQPPEGEKPTEASQPDPALAKRMRKVEGYVGSINDKLNTLTATLEKSTTGDTEAQAQVAASLKHIKEIEESIGEFKEFAPFKDELEAIREDMAAMATAPSQQNRLSPEDVTEAVGQVLLNTQHPDWQEVTKTSEFRGFMLAGGPTEAAYIDYAKLLNNPQTAAQAKEIEEDWKEDHPEWWNDKGQTLFSENPADSIKLLDRYSDERETRNQQQKNQQRQSQRRQDRLASSATPQGVESDPITGLTDDEAFNAGFKRARGR